MKKNEFIGRLRWFAETDGSGLPDEYGHPDYRPSRGETLLARMFADWLDDPGVQDDNNYEEWCRHVPDLVVDAFADFSTAEVTRWTSDRRTYKLETKYDVPDLVDSYAGGIHRVPVILHVCRLLPLLAHAPWLREHLAAKLRAQDEVVDHAWRRFARRAYREVMPRIRSEVHRGNSGVFGRTRLLTWECAERVLFTFRRGAAHVTYVADAKDRHGHRAGPNPLGAPYADCVSMIDEVTAGWDLKLLRRDDEVGIG